MTLQVGAVVCGFLVQGLTPLPDVGGRMWRMVYERNGAELVWLERDDDVKTFALAFKTLPEDDTGVAHILEHSVLSGSENYPVKSPFDELRKSSICVFMNAMTAPDQTCYPFSTRNDRDFLNLADVYLDAVFHPTAVKSPMAFRQEGWHFEIDPKTGKPFYNGVVYNEMKGVRADPERVATREILKHLYPDTVYGHSSGGEPEAIPSLTFEGFCAFYRKYYHPSNAYIFLDGRVDIAAVLAKLDKVLAPYARAAKAPAIPIQKPVSCAMTIPYPSKADGAHTILADAWSVGTGRDLVRQEALDILMEYLAGSNEAPLKRALLSRGLCEEIYLYASGYQQQPIVLIVRNTTEEKAAACRAAVRETIDALLGDGLDRTRLRAIINASEFAAREVDTARPRGLAFCARAMGSWRYGGDPAEGFDLTGLYAKLRAGVDAGMFETYLREAFVGNPHHVELTYVPSRTAVVPEAKVAVDDVEAVTRDARALEAYQKRVDSPAARASIPTLRLADIPKSGHVVEHAIATNGAVTVITTRPTSDGIAYVNAYFPADALDADELCLLPLLARLYGKLPTARHDALALDTEITDKVGRMTFLTAATERGNYLVAELAVLANRGEAAAGLLREVLLETRFDDADAVERILRQKCLAAEREVISRGDHLAERHAASGFSPRWTARDLMHGYGQLRWLQGAKADGAMLRRLAAMAKKTIVRDGLVLSVTDNLPEDVRRNLCDFPGRTEKGTPAPLGARSDDLAGIRIDGDAGFSATLAKVPDDTPYEGAMRVANAIVSREHLHREIRERGGAYGTGLSIRPEGLVSAYTYRDPTPVASRQAIVRSGEALEAFAASGESLDRYIVASIAEMDPYRSPSDEASRPIELYLAKRTLADLARERAQVLATSRSDLVRIAEMLKRTLPGARSLVVGGERQLKGLPPEKVEMVGRFR